jgi:hypothetical protein
VIAYHVFAVSTNQTTGVNTEKGGEKLEVTPLHYSGVLAGEEPNDWFSDSLAWWLAICMFGVRSEACAYVRNSTKSPQHMACPPRDWSYLAMISGRTLNFWMPLPVRVHTHNDRSTATTRLVTSRYSRARQTRIS